MTLDIPFIVRTRSSILSGNDNRMVWEGFPFHSKDSYFCDLRVEILEVFAVYKQTTYVFLSVPDEFFPNFVIQKVEA